MMPRPFKQLSQQDLDEIEMLAGIGLTQQQIADVKNICVETLMKHAGVAWKRGKSKGIGKVARKCFDMATSGKHPVMTMFYLKTQGGWSVTPALPEALQHLFRNQQEE